MGKTQLLVKPLVILLLSVFTLAACSGGGSGDSSESGGSSNPDVSNTDSTDSPGSDPGAQATTVRVSPLASGNWSDPAIWPDQKLPLDDYEVVIPQNITITLDANTPELRTLAVYGTLDFIDRDLKLIADNVIVDGELSIGSEATPFQHKAEIILTGVESDADVSVTEFMPQTMDSGSTMGGHHHMHRQAKVDNKVLLVSGRLELHGAFVRPWTKLAATAAAGVTFIELLEEPTGWKIGDRIVIAPTDLDPYEIEEVVISSVQGNTVFFDTALQYLHYGEQQTLSNGKVLDMRAEVANLSRNITISGSDEGEIEIREADVDVVRVGYGGHTMYLPGSNIRVDGVEYIGLGLTGKLGRYAVHFHHAGDIPNSYIKNSAVHHTLQRGIVVHRTNELLVENNVVFDTVGHQYYIEDGVELDNKFYGNLAMLPRETPQDLRVDLEDEKEGSIPGAADTLRRDERASSFWITNAANEFIGNHAVAVGHGQGFFFIGPDHHIPDGRETAIKTRARTPMKTFRDNVAHTIAHDQAGNFNLTYGPEWTGVALDFSRVRATNETPYAGIPNPPIENFVAWKVTNIAVNVGGFGSPFVNLIVAEARTLTHSPQGSIGSAAQFLDSTFIGKTQNNPVGRDVSEHIRSYIGGGFRGPLLAGTSGGRRIEIINGDIYGQDELVSLHDPARPADLLIIDNSTTFHSNDE